MTKEEEIFLEILKYNSDEKLIKMLNDSDINWIKVLGYLTYHRVTGLAYEKVNSIDVRLFDFPVFFTTYMINQAQKIRTIEQNKWIMIISKELIKNNINHVFLKGAILNNCLYSCGSRSSNDIDILINIKSINKVTKILNNLGFVQGKYNYKKNKIDKFSHEEIEKSIKTRGETSPFIKLSNSNAIKTIDIDINFSLDWNPNMDANIIDTFLNSRILMKNINNNEFIYSLDYKYNFIELCCHLYKDSVLIDIIKKRKVLDIYKFVDIYYFIKKYFSFIDIDELYREIIRFNLSDCVYFSLKYITNLFPDSNDEKISYLIESLNTNNEILNTIFDQYNQSIKMTTNCNCIEQIFSYNIIKNYKENNNDKYN